MLSILIGRYLASKSLQSIYRIITASNNIGTHNLFERMDISSNDEFTELSHAVNTMMDCLQLGFERIRQFTGNAAHELKNPLTSIRGTLEVALSQERTVNEYQ